MRASVVVAVKDDPRLNRLVERLLDQTVPREAYEVLVGWGDDRANGRVSR